MVGRIFLFCSVNENLSTKGFFPWCLKQLFTRGCQCRIYPIALFSLTFNRSTFTLFQKGDQNQNVILHSECQLCPLPHKTLFFTSSLFHHTEYSRLRPLSMLSPSWVLWRGEALSCEIFFFFFFCAKDCIHILRFPSPSLGTHLATQLSSLHLHLNHEPTYPVPLYSALPSSNCLHFIISLRMGQC